LGADGRSSYGAMDSNCGFRGISNYQEIVSIELASDTAVD
jgi:hypothetical protein